MNSNDGNQGNKGLFAGEPVQDLLRERNRKLQYLIQQISEQDFATKSDSELAKSVLGQTDLAPLHLLKVEPGEHAQGDQSTDMFWTVTVDGTVELLTCQPKEHDIINPLAEMHPPNILIFRYRISSPLEAQRVI